VDAEAAARRGRGLGPARAWCGVGRAWARLKRVGVPRFDHVFLKNFE
jgi:hypothetical protein